jgi:CelD/BcsL family acetyltransferase involved in cellulose biosynthesis
VDCPRPRQSPFRSAGPVNWQVVTDRGELGGLEGQWRSMENRWEGGTPFQSYAWCRLWLEHRGKRYSPFVLVSPDRAVIAPFAATTIAGVRVLRLIGTGDSDYLGLATSLPAGHAWQSVVSELHHRRSAWHVLHLHSIRNKKEVLSALQAHSGIATIDRDYERCPILSTNGTWDAYLDRRTKIRRESKRWAKRVHELGDITVTSASAPLAPELLGEMDDVERESWKWESGTAAFRPGEQADFIRAILSEAEMPARVWCLRANARLAAFAVVLEGRSGWYYYLPSFRRSYPNAGAHLLSGIVQAAFAQGCSFVDLLQGDHGYKSLWTDETVGVAEILAANSLRGRVMLRGYVARWRASNSPVLRRLRNIVKQVGDRRGAKHVL